VKTPKGIKRRGRGRGRREREKRRRRRQERRRRQKENNKKGSLKPIFKLSLPTLVLSLFAK
jgi:hypothetical protein